MDKYLVSLAFFLLCLECGWLAEDLNLVDMPWLQTKYYSDSKNSLGEIKFVKRNVRRKANSSLVWEETRDTQKVFAYDSVLTLDQSAAEVNLNSGTKITLHENTLVSIEPTTKDSVSGPVRLRFGRGSLRATQGRNPSSIGAGEWTVEAEPQSQISVRSIGKGQYEIESHGGVAKIVGTHVAQVIKIGQTVNIKDQKISEPKPVLDLDWQEPRDGQRFYTHNSTVDVNFDFKNGGASKDLKIAIYNPDNNHSEEIKTLIEHQSVPMKTGNYSIQLENLGVSTFARNISVWSAPKIYLLDPLPRQRIRIGKSLELNWTLNSEISNYIWQIASDGSFKTILREGETDQNFAEILDMPLGSYFWRVQGKDDQGFLIPETYYNPFTIVSKPLEAPKLKSPHIIREDETLLFKIWNWLLPQAVGDDLNTVILPKHYKAEFQWEKVEGAAQYSIEMSETPDFRKIVFSARTLSPRYVWKNFKLGEYFWRVAAIAEDGEQGIFSEGAIADLKTIPRGPITPEGPNELPKVAVVTKVKNVATASPPPAPTATPVQKLAPALTPQKLAPTPIPTPELTYVYHPYKMSVELGSHYTYEYFKGSDFTATVSGPYLGDVRLSLLSPFESLKDWRGELEFQRVVVKTTNAQAFPFQDQGTNYGFDLTLIHENHFEGEVGWGFGFLNEFSLFQRAAAEDLAIKFPLLAGPVMDWRNLHNDYETHYRLAGYLGVALALEARASYIILVPFSESVTGTLTFEARGVGGIMSGGSYWGSGTGVFYLGVRW